MIKFLRKYQAPTALIYCALILTLMEYFLLPGRVETLRFGPSLFGGRAPSLSSGLVWVTACVLLYFLIPFVHLKFVLKELPSRFGLLTDGFLKHLKAYLFLYLLMCPLIYVAFLQPEFSRLYPFVPEAKASWSSFVIWEIAYICQFFALESFFRGYLLFTLEKHTTEKWLAIAMMTVPYTMIHFHKPLPECLGAIIAGLALGWMALRYRSWLGGAILHSLVAVTMDALSATN